MSRNYRITRPDEETECENCGCPLYVGDNAYPGPFQARIYCGNDCRTTGELRRALEHEAACTPGTEPHSSAHRGVLRLEADAKRAGLRLRP